MGISSTQKALSITFFRTLLIGGILCFSLISACAKHEIGATAQLAAIGIGFKLPEIENVLPANKDTGVDLEQKLLVRFNIPLDDAMKNLVQVELQAGASIVPGNLVFNDSVAVFTPKGELDPHTVYSASVFFQDSTAGSGKATKHAWRFTTQGRPIYTMERRSDSVTLFERDGSKLMQVGDYLYCYGGWSRAPDSYNEVYRSTGDLSSWEQLPNAPWHRRHTFGIGKIDSTVYIFGGDHLYNEFDVWRTNDGQTFEQVTESLDNTIGRRLLYGACVHNNKLFVLGGQSALDHESVLTDVWVSDDGANWSQIARDKQFLGKNISGAVASFNGRIWVVGGGKYANDDAGKSWTNHIYSSKDGKNWRREKDAPWSGRQYHDVYVWDNKLWVVGGHNGKNLADIWYMKRDGKWVKFETPPGFEARHATALAEYNNQLVIACGNYHNDCWVIKRVY